MRGDSRISMYQELIARQLIDKLAWRLVYAYGDEWLVYPSFSSENSKIGMGLLPDVSEAMVALGWFKSVSNIPRSEIGYFGEDNYDTHQCEFEMRFMLRLWNIASAERLVTLLRYGFTEDEARAIVENDIDPEMLLSAKSGLLGAE